MNPRRQSGCRSGITLIEIIVVVVVIGVVATLLLAFLRSRTRYSRLGCINNIKQVGLGFRQWGMDYGDRFPMELTMEQGGTKDHPLAHEAWVHLWVLSNEINTPKVLACPNDPERMEASDFSTPGTLKNVSYFVGLDADQDNPQMLLMGDRNLTADGKPVSTGIHAVSPSAVHGWTKAIHNRHGYVGFADGSAQELSSADLQQYLRDNPQTNRLAIP